jgi:DNA repair protein RadC
VNRESSFTVRDLPRQERPRERLQKFGPEALFAQDLLEKAKREVEELIWEK